ncbi:MAG: carboxypeptidase-like regulatory domain-containing protein [Cryomorphaceae bacterium]|nr:carboxypeptidase-like regulatory domain-containing protein [Cryomorphaceae bacterium]
MKWLYILLLFSQVLYGQKGTVWGVVVNVEGISLSEVHVVNKNTTKGTITNVNGRFRLTAQVNDTLVFSLLSHKYLYYRVNDEDFETPLRIVLKKEEFLLDEVSIFSYKLTSNEPKAMKLRKPAVPDDEDIREPGLPSPAGLANPIDAVYQAFSKRIKQLKILETYKERDRFQTKLEEGNNRDILMRVTGMTQEELKPFLFFCQMGPDFIASATDYELLISLLVCYKEYVHNREMQEYMSDY